MIMRVELVTLSVCVDCVYFNEYGRLDDQTMEANPATGREHAARIAAVWPAGTEFTSGCGRDCPDHGLAAYGEDKEPESWFSWLACEECGSRLGGDRAHATAWITR